MKRCTKCEQTKPLSEFRKNKNSPDGHQYYCKSCASIQTKTNYVAYKDKVSIRTSARLISRRQMLNDIKKTGCVCCSETHLTCLDFHHVDPTQKEFMVSARYHMNLELLLAEVAKCVVVCKNCHAKIHDGVLTIPFV